MGKRMKSKRLAKLEDELLRTESLGAEHFDMNSDAAWEDDILERYEAERWNAEPDRPRRKRRLASKDDRDDEYFEDSYFERGA